ncbi:MAG: calcium-binding protein [Hellea sp.]
MATALDVGELAIIQYGSDSPDPISFVILTDIDADTEIKFTDKGYDANLDSFITSEGILTWTPGVALPAGTVITIVASGGGTYTATNATTGAVLGTVIQTGSFNLATAGDSIFAFQGDITGTAADAGLIYGVNFGDDDATNPLDANGWNTLAIDGDTNESNLPDELNSALNGGINASYGNPAEIDNGFYNGITEGTPAEILAAIADPANWTTSNAVQGAQTFPVFAPNTAPLLADLETANLSFDELGGEQNVTDNLTLSDSGDLTGATLTISAGFDMANDALNFTDQNGITGVYDAMSGILTLSGTTTAANYQTAIRSVTYDNAFTTESTATRTVSVVVTDGPNTTAAISRDIDFVIDNTVDGTAGDDTLQSGFGTDVINGNDGNDRLFGQDGDDTLNGGSGNDQLTGGAGADVLNGGTGMDVVYYNGSTSAVEFNLATGGTAGDATGDSFISIERVYGSAFDDVMTGDANVNVLYGLNGMDIISGEGGNDLLYGQNGDDTLNGGDGVDRLFGGDDMDTLNGDAGDDFLYGQAGNDMLFGGLDNDLLSGGAGDDDLNGDAGNDTILAGAGGDNVMGGAGDDIINGQSGINNLLGGDGNDTLISGTGDDFLSGGAGIDRVLYSSSATAVTVNLADDTGFGGNAEGDTFSSIENLYGSQFNDDLTGDDLDNTISGLGGNDVINGGGGNDRLVGAAGDDMLFGGAGDDILIAQEGADTLDGGAGADRLIGGVDDDVLTGGADNDLLLGQGGADTFIFGGAHGADRIVDFEQGVDMIEFDGTSGLTSFGDLTITQTGAHVLIMSSAGTIAVNNALVADFDASDFDFAAPPMGEPLHEDFGDLI